MSFVIRTRWVELGDRRTNTSHIPLYRCMEYRRPKFAVGLTVSEAFSRREITH